MTEPNAPVIPTWSDGASVLYTDDALHILSLLPDKSVDLVVCDLPYGITQNKWDIPIPMDKMWEQLRRVTKDNAAVCLFATTPFDKVLAMSNLAEFKYEWIWEKERGTGHLNANKAPLRSHEHILVFYRTLPVYNAQMRSGSPYKAKQSSNGENYGKSVGEIVTTNKGERFPVSVLKFGRDRPFIHPTQKPVALIQYLIRTYSNPGEVVLDFTCGSGTTAVAALKENRRFICVDNNVEYTKLTQERIAKEIK